MTVANQCWLGTRINVLGLLTSAITVHTVAARLSISPSQSGTTLGYMISSTQQLSRSLLFHVTELENDVNPVDRVTHYVKNIEQGPPHEIPEATQRVLARSKAR